MKRLENVLLAVAFVCGCIAWAGLIESPNPPHWWVVLLAMIAVTLPVLRWATRG